MVDDYHQQELEAPLASSTPGPSQLLSISGAARPARPPARHVGGNRVAGHRVGDVPPAHPAAVARVRHPVPHTLPAVGVCVLSALRRVGQVRGVDLSLHRRPARRTCAQLPRDALERAHQGTHHVPSRVLAQACTGRPRPAARAPWRGRARRSPPRRAARPARRDQLHLPGRQVRLHAPRRKGPRHRRAGVAADQRAHISPATLPGRQQAGARRVPAEPGPRLRKGRRARPRQLRRQHV